MRLRVITGLVCAIFLLLLAAGGLATASHVAESSCTMQAVQLAAGMPIYRDPALGVAASTHAPLYYVCLALVLRFLDADPVLVGRIVSVAALVAGLVAFAIDARRSAEPIASWVALLWVIVAQLALGTPGITARADGGLPVALVSAVAFLAGLRGRPALSLAGVALAVAAAFVKQPLAWLPIFEVATAFRLGGARQGMRCALVAAVAVSALGVLAWRVAGPFLVFYTITFPRSQPGDTVHLLANGEAALPAVFTGLVLSLLPVRELGGARRALADPRLQLSLLALGASAVTSVKVGASVNAYLPYLYLTPPWLASAWSRASVTRGRFLDTGFFPVVLAAVGLVSGVPSALRSFDTHQARTRWLATLEETVAPVTSGQVFYTEPILTWNATRRLDPFFLEVNMEAAEVAPHGFEATTRAILDQRYDAIVVVRTREYLPGYAAFERALEAASYVHVVERASPPGALRGGPWSEPSVGVYVRRP